MKQFGFIALSVLALGISSCSNNNKFEIEGNIQGLNNQQVYLEALGVNNIQVVDSAMSDKNGKFELQGTSTETGLYRLRMPQERFLLLAIDHGKVRLKANIDALENYTIEGSAPSESLKNYLSTVRGYMTDFNTLYIVMDSMKARGNDSMLDLAHKDLEERNAQFTKFIEGYADTVSYLPNALFAVQMLNPESEKTFLTDFSNKLEKRFPKSAMAKEFNVKFKELMASMQQPAPAPTSGITIGAAAPEISLSEPSGNTIKLSSLKGKYVLIDFWASWCGPCRAENPNVVAAFEKMKNKNFTILGVSLDNDKNKWMAAIVEDKLNWKHVSDLQGWQSVAARDYNIQSIPANFLLDPEGKIIAKDLRGPDLEAALVQLVK